MAENEKKYVYRVEIDTMEDAKQLVAVSTKLQGRITLQSGNKFAVNAKSLLGVLLAKKLNWDDLILRAVESVHKPPGGDIFCHKKKKINPSASSNQKLICSLCERQ